MKPSLKISSALLFPALIFSISKLFSQSGNLCGNSSFEIFDTCVTNQSQIHYAIGWKSYGYSPEYFNSCSTNPNFSVPYNWGGYQQTATGNAYAGIYTYESNMSNETVREIIGYSLISPLNIGVKYYVSFKVSLALDTNHNFNQATNNLGVLFSTVQYDISNPAPINNFAHIYSASAITDTANWVTISDSIIADSAYKYIAIGNFFNDANTIVVQMQDTIISRAAYYYIDDVAVTKDTTTEIKKYSLQEKIKIYFNSANGNLIIQQNCLQNSVVKIYNIAGQLLIQLSTESNKIFSIDFSSQPNGIYIINIQTKDGSISKKIVK